MSDKRIRVPHGKKAPTLGGSQRDMKMMRGTDGDRTKVAVRHQKGMYGHSRFKPEPDDGVKRTQPKLTQKKRRRLEKVSV